MSKLVVSSSGLEILPLPVEGNERLSGDEWLLSNGIELLFVAIDVGWEITWEFAENDPLGLLLLLFNGLRWIVTLDDLEEIIKKIK